MTPEMSKDVSEKQIRDAGIQGEDLDKQTFPQVQDVGDVTGDSCWTLCSG